MTEPAAQVLPPEKPIRLAIVPAEGSFTARQTVTVDGQESSPPNVKAIGVPPVRDDLSSTGHVVANMSAAESEDLCKRLSPEQPEIMAVAIRGAGADQDKLKVESAEGPLSALGQGGVTVTHPGKNAFVAHDNGLPLNWQGGVLTDICGKIQAAKLAVCRLAPHSPNG